MWPALVVNFFFGMLKLLTNAYPPSQNLCRMEFLNQTAAIFVTRSLLLKFSKHVDYTLIDDKDKCYFVSVTSSWNKIVCKIKVNFKMWLFFERPAKARNIDCRTFNHFKNFFF